MNFKNIALGLGITTLTSIAALPSIDGFWGQGAPVGNASSAYSASIIGVFKSDNLASDVYDDDDDEYDDYDSYFISQVYPEEKLKTYMEYMPEFFYSDIEIDDEAWEHLTNESPDAFEDDNIREMAEYYSEYFNLTNCRYEAKYYGVGLGFGDHIFTDGFSFVDDPDNPTESFYFVKSTADEFNDYIEAMKQDYEVTASICEPDDGYIAYSFEDAGGEVCEVYYYVDEEIIFQETIINY